MVRGVYHLGPIQIVIVIITPSKTFLIFMLISDKSCFENELWRDSVPVLNAHQAHLRNTIVQFNITSYVKSLS